MSDIWIVKNSIFTWRVLSGLIENVYRIQYQYIRVITKLPNSEQSYKGKVKTHNYINKENQSTTGKLWKISLYLQIKEHQLGNYIRTQIYSYYFFFWCACLVILWPSLSLSDHKHYWIFTPPYKKPQKNLVWCNAVEAHSQIPIRR